MRHTITTKLAHSLAFIGAIAALTVVPLHLASAADDDEQQAAAEEPEDTEAEAQDRDTAPVAEPLGESDIQELGEMQRRLSDAAQEMSSKADRALTPEEVLRQIPTPQTPARIFSWMQEHIDYEPYTGAMRGPEGALITGYANAADQALLAQALLEEAGHQVRFVTGDLHESDTQRIVDSARGQAALSTPDGRVTLEADEIDEPDLRPIFNAVKQHLWLEIDVEGTPRPFDPVASPNYGMTTADAEERHEELPDRFQTHFRMRMISELDDGRSLEHIALEGPVPEVAFESITLSFEDDPTRTHGFHPHLTVGGEGATGETVPADAVERLAMEFRYRTGRHEHRWEQVMYRRGQGVDVFDFDHQHFAIAVAPGPISNDKVNRLSADATAQAAEAMGEWIDVESGSDVDVSDRRDWSNRTFDAFGAVFPFAFTRILDRSANELARNLGVRAIYESPRVVTAGLLRDGQRFHLDVQVDGDRIRAIPRAGIPPMAATSYLGLYGMIRDELTSDILEAYDADGDHTVRHIFRLVTQQSPRVRTIYSANIDDIDGLDIGDNTRDVMRQQIRQRDMVLLTPNAAVDDDGIERFGWWALTPHRGNIEGHRADALLTAEDRIDELPVDSRPLLESHLIMLARHFQAVQHATGDEMHFPQRACSAVSLYGELSRIFCAQSQPLAAQELSQCFDGEPTSDGGGGLLGFTQVDCTDLVAPTRCGAAYASSVLGGELGVSDETTPTPRSALCR